MSPHPLDGWMPIRLYRESTAGVMVDWCDMGGVEFTDPFFSDTVTRRLRDPYALLFRQRTTIDELVEYAEQVEPALPAGFVYHMSRCGSTLVTQLLARSPRHLVLSEPAPVESLLQVMLRSADGGDERWTTRLRALLAVMARPRNGGGQRCVVKLDAWHALALPLLRRAVPEVPWVFVHRDPVEVLVSHARERSAQMLAGLVPPWLLGLSLADAAVLSSDEYAARVIGCICEAALAHLDDDGLAVAYDDLPEAVWTTIAPHFGLHLDATDVERMRANSGDDAKRPGRSFTPDSADKRASASAQLRAVAGRWATPAWSRLPGLERGVSAAVGAA
jgi:hypothetical protein